MQTLRRLEEDRDRIERALGLPLPFDNDTLDFLLRTATAASPQEFREMLSGYCPRWPPDKQTSLVRELVDASAALLGLGPAAGSYPSGKSSSSTTGARFGGSGAADAMERDRLLAKMLQDEEDAEHTLAKAQNTSGRKGRKPAKKDFKPMNINFSVAAGQTPASLGTSAPSSLADMLRNRRSQDQHPPDLSSQHFGPPVSRGGGPSPFAGGTTNSFADVLRNGRRQDQRDTGQADRPMPQSGPPAYGEVAVGAAPPSSSAEKLRNRGPPPPAAPVPSPPPASAPRTSKRDALIRNAFQAFDVNADGLLDKKELRAFADATGFSGTEEEWNEEFRALCRDHRGLDLATFTQLVNDHSEGGCFCEDHELAAMAASKPKKVDPRSELIAKAFRVCDVNGDGKLDMRELRTFATFTGFQGGDEEWREEYRLLCKEQQALDGIDLTAFTQMVNDESDSGCFCTNEELDTIIKRGADQSLRTPQATAQPSKTLPSEGLPSQTPASLGTNAPLADQLRSGRGQDQHPVGLSTQHLVPPPGLSSGPHVSRGGPSPFAGATTDSFADVLRNGRDQDQRHTEQADRPMPQSGPPASGGFAAGAWASSSSAEKLQNRGPPSAAPVPSPPPTSAPKTNQRDALIRNAFQAFDVDADGLLDKKELRAFANATGFSGNEEEWNDEFRALCRDHRGLDLATFTQLVNDHSEEGCFCEDHELAAMAASKPQKIDPRSELIAKAFRMCDANGDGKLDMGELRTFATFTGFDGTDEEWQEEYLLLCRERQALDGINLIAFTQMVNDESDSGCFCTTDELETIISKLADQPLRTPQATAQPSKTSPSEGVLSPPSAAPPVSSPPPTSGPKSNKRDALICDAFQAFDVNADGLLDKKELRAFAEATGFSGTEEEWNDEFRALCRDQRGVDLAAFTQLVNDHSEEGCFCEDHELAAMAASKPKKVDPRSELIARAFQVCDANGDGKLDMRELRTFATFTGFDGTDEEWREEYLLLCRERPALDGINISAFTQMVNDESDSGCFCTNEELETIITKLAADQPLRAPQAFDVNADGLLDKKELRAFADAAGFSGAEEACDDEIRAPYRDHRAIDPAAFTQLVNDHSEEGRFRNDHEPAAMGASKPKEVDARSELIAKAFRVCDANGDGKLDMRELRTFAAFTGFDGTDEEWREEYLLLCRERQALDGINLTAFTQMVNDESDSGCFCTNEELETFIAKLASQSLGTPQELRACADAPGFSGTAEVCNDQSQGPCRDQRGIDLATSAQLVNDHSEERRFGNDHESPATAASKPKTGDARSELIAKAFRVCDANGDGRLDMRELRAFAAFTGFDGTDEEWREEYLLLCRERQALNGINLTAFTQMVNDESDSGCFCTNEELETIITKLAGQPLRTPQAPEPNMNPHVGAAQPLSRQELARAVFRACDADNDGYLSMNEMHSFAQHIGFDGRPQDWANEYEGLCADHGCSSHVGVDVSLFLRLIDDESDIGCYCQDSELREMLRTLVPKVAASRMGSAQRR